MSWTSMSNVFGLKVPALQPHITHQIYGIWVIAYFLQIPPKIEEKLNGLT